MADPVRHICGIAAPMASDNIDTDQIIPSREIKGASKQGLGASLFANLRFTDNASRQPDPNFVLNKAPYYRAKVIIAGENFGCGSSREHAVWALKDFGIEAIVAKSFGEIFYNNCINNSIAAIELRDSEIEQILCAINERPGMSVEIDIEAEMVRAGTDSAIFHVFELKPADRDRLLCGMDAIEQTSRHAATIKQFVNEDKFIRPWAYCTRK